MSPESILPLNNPVFLFILLTWSIFWKGMALWRAAQNRQRNWFIVILIISTFGIIEIIYLFKFSKKPLTLSELRGYIKR